MSPFENLIKELGSFMGIDLKPDTHESCRIVFYGKIAVQIDLNPNADTILMGTELGFLQASPFRDAVFKQALRVNGLSKLPRGVLCFSEKKEELILYQYLPLSHLTGEKLYKYLQLFLDHAHIWVDSLETGEVPQLEEDLIPPLSLR